MATSRRSASTPRPHSSERTSSDGLAGIQSLGDGGSQGAPTAQGPADSGERPSGLRGVLETVGLVVAPTTLLAAVALYFGFVLTASRAAYFGIDHSTLALSRNDYMLRSTDALFVPLGALVLAGLVALAAHSITGGALDRDLRVSELRWVVRILGLVGLLLFAFGVAALFRPPVVTTYYLVPPLSLGIGAALLAYAVYFERRARARGRSDKGADSGRPLSTLSVVLVSLLVLLSIFWATNEYASALGRGRAQQLAAALSSRPGVVIYSNQRLGITGPGIDEQRLAGSDLAYQYRYSGLRLLIRSGGKFFMLPTGWTRDQGSVIVLPESRSIRLEFLPGQ